MLEDSQRKANECGNKDGWSAFCHYEMAEALDHVGAHINAERLLQQSAAVKAQFQVADLVTL